MSADDATPAGPVADGDEVRRVVGEESSDAAPTRSGAAGSGSGAWAWAPWVAMALLALVALGVAVAADDGPTTNAERVYALSRTIACPVCDGQSVAESDVSIAKEIRRDVAARVEAGQTDEQIRAFYADRFGQDTLLTPSAEGTTGLVWVLPVVVAVAALAGLGAVLWRWRSQPARHASAEDRALVEAALGTDGDGRRSAAHDRGGAG